MLRYLGLIGAVAVALVAIFYPPPRAAFSAAVATVAPSDAEPVPRATVATHYSGRHHRAHRRRKRRSDRRRKTPRHHRSFSGIVSVNASGSDALARVPGIGPAIAARIVDVREQDGAYASLDELLDVAGMTASRLERARRYLSL